ncbi:TPA: hypothetical protein KOT48_003681 [Clostridioides difficile]|nr:hypothetical protein [Clostridioides difficile]
MSTEQKIRKNINVSIQSKQYNETINNVLNDWEYEGLNISTEVCNSILISDKIAKSPTLLSVLNIYDLTEKILNLYKVNDKDALEEALSKLISIKGDEITKILNIYDKNVNGGK